MGCSRILGPKVTECLPQAMREAEGKNSLPGSQFMQSCKLMMAWWVTFFLCQNAQIPCSAQIPRFLPIPWWLRFEKLATGFVQQRSGTNLQFPQCKLLQSGRYQATGCNSLFETSGRIAAGTTHLPNPVQNGQAGSFTLSLRDYMKGWKMAKSQQRFQSCSIHFGQVSVVLFEALLEKSALENKLQEFWPIEMSKNVIHLWGRSNSNDRTGPWQLFLVSEKSWVTPETQFCRRSSVVPWVLRSAARRKRCKVHWGRKTQVTSVEIEKYWTYWNQNSSFLNPVNLNIQRYPKHKICTDEMVQESCWATFEAVFGASGMALLLDIATFSLKVVDFNGFYHQFVAIWGGNMMITRGFFWGTIRFQTNPYPQGLNGCASVSWRCYWKGDG